MGIKKPAAQSASAKPAVSEQKKFVQKDFTGAMFENDKDGNEKRPDLKGSVILEGTEYWVSGWYKTSFKGKEFISLSFQSKGED
jgi:hypothetical protein